MIFIVLGKTDKYEIGEHVIWRVYKKEMGQVFNVSITYELISIDNRTLEIQDINSKRHIFNKHYDFGQTLYICLL